jgi:YVTN family beta-propeller protein
MRRFALFAFFLAITATPLAGQQITTGAVFGTVVPVRGILSDMVLDSFRQRLYLVNSSANRVDVFSTATNQLIGSIAVGRAPLAAAISMDAAALYVTNSADKTLSVIDLGMQRVTQTVSMPATPEGVEVGYDGRVLISTQSASAQTLLIFDPAQIAGQQLTTVITPPPPSTPAPLPAQTTTRPQTPFNDKLIRTPDGQFIVGLTNPGTNGAQTYLFVYESASGIILRSRTVVGQSTVLSMAPDGSRFMAGYTLYETATLSVIAQQNNGNAPFPFNAAFSTQQNVGGSVFSADGNILYSAFNIQPSTGTNPPPRSNSSTLLIGDGRNLGINLGIRLPESIVSKMVILPSGAVYSLSASGMIYLPLQNLYDYPIIQPETTQIFLSLDPCSRGIPTGTLKMNNLGKGKLTYAVTSLNPSLTTEESSGLAPSSVKFTLEPGRIQVNRQSGTNLTTGLQMLPGIPLEINISSNEAINLPSTIRVYMNIRDADQRGIIYPIPTVPNNSPQAPYNPTFNGGNEGIQDIVLDQGRNLVYLSNSGYNRIEVFDTVSRKYLDPIPVGNTGGELISIVDLSQTPARTVGTVNFPPLPRQGGGLNTAVLNPRSLAYGLFGLEFIMSNGSQWKLAANNVATVRPLDTVTRINGSSLFATPTSMIASPDAFSILTLAGNGNGFLYDSVTDSYTGLELLFPTQPPISGYYGPIAAGPAGSYFLAGGLTLNGSLNVLYGNANASAVQRNVYALAPVDANNYLRFTTSFRANIGATAADEQRPTLELVNVPSGQATLIGPVAEQPRYTVFGTTRTNVPARQMVVDNAGTAYLVTLSGLSVVPLTVNGAPRPQLAATRSIVNATDGTTTLRPGSFVNVVGTWLADTATADLLPAPTVLGGSCVTFNDVSLPLFRTSSGQIQAQIPANVDMGTNVVVVRSLSTGQASDPVVVTVQPGAPN